MPVYDVIIIDSPKLDHVCCRPSSHGVQLQALKCPVIEAHASQIYCNVCQLGQQEECRKQGTPFASLGRLHILPANRRGPHWQWPCLVFRFLVCGMMVVQISSWLSSRNRANLSCNGCTSLLATDPQINEQLRRSTCQPKRCKRTYRKHAYVKDGDILAS